MIVTSNMDKSFTTKKKPSQYGAGNHQSIHDTVMPLFRLKVLTENQPSSRG